MYNFDAALPGESLTKTPGSMPMEHPPQFTNPNDALEYLFGRFTSPKQATKLILLLKKGVPVEYLVNTLLFEGIAQGKWTVDVALLMYQVTYWQIESIGKLKGIKYKGKNNDPKHDDFLSQFVDLLDNTDTPPSETSSVPAKTSIFKGLANA